MKRRRSTRPFSPHWWLGETPDGEHPARWQTVLALVFVVLAGLSCARYLGWL